MLKTRTWILLFAAAALALGLLSWRLLGTPVEGTVVEVVQDGVVLREIDLSAVREAYSFVVTWPDGGSNTVLVEPGRICVAEADCPDGLCVRQGWLSDRGAPLVCLPHRLVIRLKGEGALDGVSR
ncbi:MAG: NusG domain II-containing protein [Oscillospiraceae bacterium]|nr:NusG domain II-containing protein [Oscillospiraceae bacterium]